MKKLCIYSLILMGFGAISTWATPTCVDGGTLASYVALGAGGCQIGDKVFTDFVYAPTATGGATPVLAGNVTVDTIGPNNSGTILGPDIGLQFAGAWSASSGEVNDGAIDFTVSVVGGGPMLIEDAGLAQTSSVVANGVASVGESGCGPAVCTPGTWNVITFNAGDGNTQQVNHTFFTPTGSIQVAKDINANGGSMSGSFADLSIVQDTFSQTSVPEPATIFLFGLPLVGVGLVRVRRRLAHK